jgi:hypothetical protein
MNGKIEPKRRGWKEGILSETLESFGGTKHLKGAIVRYKKYKIFDTETHGWTGKYEWHYMDQTNYNLIRCSKLLIVE